MASKRTSGRVTKKEVKYFKEDSSDEEEEEGEVRPNENITNLAISCKTVL